MKMPARAAADAAMLLAIVAAVGALPPVEVPWPWLVGYALPALVLLVSQRRAPRRPVVGVALAALTLFSASAALRARVPSTGAAPIACLLIAPLVYFALRRQSGDRRYALFLALCVLVVGSVLDFARAQHLAVVFLVAGTLMLFLENATSARGADHLLHRRVAPVRRAWHAALIAATSVLTAASLFQVLSHLPVPDRNAPLPAPVDDPQKRIQGLSTQFDLSPADGWLETVRDLQGHTLAAVRCDDGPTPADLYLRFVHFDLAGANRWATARYMPYQQPEPDAWSLFAPPDGAARVRYTIEREPLANGHLLLPQGTWRVQDIAGLVGNGDVGVLRERTPSDDTLTYSALATAPGARVGGIDLRATDLLSLPEALTAGEITALAQSYVRDAGREPLMRALAIARGLRRDYTYSRRDPTGPRPDALHNFLFHARAGYCMHFASAMAVMLRLQRIPCRVGAGLYGGRPDERPGFRTFGAADAHAWVELPRTGGGWMVLDPTPEETRAALGREREINVPEGSAAPAPASAGAAPASTSLWLLAAMFLLGLVLVPTLRRPTATPGARTAAAQPVAHQARVLLSRMLDRLDALGLPRRRHETLAELATRAAKATDVDAGALADAFTAYEEVRFGGAPWDAARAGRMQAGAVAAAAARGDAVAV